jgi:predicted enzyme related to lactoylglutathione lyase
MHTLWMGNEVNKERQGTYTDTMVRVDSLEKSARFWIEVMGLTEVERSDSGIMLEDPSSGQRVTLVDTRMGSHFAVAVATPDMQKTLDEFAKEGAEIEQPIKAESGLEYARCKDPSGVPIMVYVAD